MGKIHVVWSDNRNMLGTPDIYYSRSSDEGRTFVKNLKINDLPGKETYGYSHPRIWINNKINIVWQGEAVGDKAISIYFSALEK